MVERPTDEPHVPAARKVVAFGAALLGAGALFVWAGWGTLLDGELSRVDLLGLVAVGCGIVVVLGGFMIVVGLAFHLREVRRAD